MMAAGQSSVRALGEIALRAKDLDGMQKFYGEVIGLPLMKRFATSAFFKIVCYDNSVG